MNIKYFLTLLIVFFGAFCQASQPQFPKRINVDAIRRMPILFNNRYMPLDTLSRMVVWKVTGSETFKDQDPVITLLTWHFNAEHWKNEAIIPVPNAKFRAAAGLNTKQMYFSLQELYSNPSFGKLVASLRGREGGDKLNPLEKGVAKARDRVTYLQKTFMGSCIKMVPGQEKLGVPFWLSAFKIQQRGEPAHLPYANAWDNLGAALRIDNPKAFESATTHLLDILKQAHGPHPSLTSERIDQELHYYNFPSLRLSWIFSITAMCWAIASVFIKRKWSDYLIIFLIAVGFAILNYHLILRGTLAGRLPAADFYESLLLIGWGAAGFGCIYRLFSKHWSIPLTSTGVAAAALLMADLLPISRFISPVKPAVLNSFWMATHVPIIIVSYAILAIAVCIAHVQAFSLAFSKEPKAKAEKIDKILQWYILVGSLLLLIGILTGAMWAAKVWGSYWKWDPKEVWSLIAFLSYMVILHVQIPSAKVTWYHYGGFSLGMAAVIGCIFANDLECNTLSVLIMLPVVGICYYFLFANSHFATATKTVLAFWTIIMTYVGVTYILGSKDLSKYDFGSGKTALRTLTIGLLDLAVFGFCAIKYYRRKKPTHHDEG